MINPRNSYFLYIEIIHRDNRNKQSQSAIETQHFKISLSIYH